MFTSGHRRRTAIDQSSNKRMMENKNVQVHYDGIIILLLLLPPTCKQ